MLVDLSVKLFFHGIETLRNIETMFFFLNDPWSFEETMNCL